MVTGPPRSGKTSLLQLLNEAAVYSKLFSPIYYVDLEEHKGDLEQGLAQHDTSWGELFAAKRTGMPHRPIPASPLQTAHCNARSAAVLSFAVVSYAGADETKLSLLLLDGAQLLFGGNPDFWSGIKALNMGPRPGQKIKTRTLRVIFTCSYVCSPSAFAGQSCAYCDSPRLPAFDWCYSIWAATDCTMCFHRTTLAGGLWARLHRLPGLSNHCGASSALDTRLPRAAEQLQEAELQGQRCLV